MNERSEDIVVRRKVRPVALVKFVKGTDFDKLGWHVAHDPSGDDRTLCGLALEGACQGRTIYKPTVAKVGQPTCTNCRAIIDYIASILPNTQISNSGA